MALIATVPVASSFGLTALAATPVPTGPVGTVAGFEGNEGKMQPNPVGINLDSNSFAAAPGQLDLNGALANCGQVKIIKRTDPHGLNQGFSYSQSPRRWRYVCTNHRRQIRT